MIKIVEDNQAKINQDLMNALMIQGASINKLSEYVEKLMNMSVLQGNRIKELQEKLKEKVEV